MYVCVCVIVCVTVCVIVCEYVRVCMCVWGVSGLRFHSSNWTLPTITDILMSCSKVPAGRNAFRSSLLRFLC